MQKCAGLELLTTAEAAEYLRLKERKLYELVAARQIPCTKVTGKWLFPRADLDRWLLSGMVRPEGVVPADPPPIVGGSHDPLLQWALSESRAGLATQRVVDELAMLAAWLSLDYEMRIAPVPAGR